MIDHGSLEIWNCSIEDLYMSSSSDPLLFYVSSSYRVYGDIANSTFMNISRLQFIFVYIY
jgi:hypothetical protein